MGVRGQLWTAWPVLRHRLKPWTAPPSSPWTATVLDADLGPVRLSGRLTTASPSHLLVSIHGLGGCSESLHQLRASRAAEERGLSSLRFEMRGSDRSGEDLYHAGLSSDLGAVLASPQLAGFEHIYLLGFSLGGHIALHYATGEVDPRLRAVVAICSPTDLLSCVEHFDEPWRWPYRRFVLSGLQDLYRTVAQRREMPVPIERIEAVRGLREWDELTVVPRFGFADTADYYRSSSVGGRLDRLKVPALLIASEGDPMVTAASIRRGLGWTRHELRVEWLETGGHVGFPEGLDLGFEGPRGLDGQAIGWLLRH